MALGLVAALAILAGTKGTRAEECPASSPEDASQRRQLAKYWFGVGEQLANASDYVNALRAYRCSLRLVPHGSTAYNVAQIAERTGDVEGALSSYKQYLLLVPNARDADEVQQRIVALKQRMDESAQAERNTRGPASRPAVALAGGESTAAPPSSTSGRRTWAWASYGGAAALMIGGVVTNLLARSRMDECRTKYDQGGRTPAAVSDAQPACDDGSRLTYTSYAFFGLGGAAVALGTFLMLRPSPSSQVALAPLPRGGLALRWRRGF